MKISKKAYYGLRAVLALARDGQALSIHTLAEREGLPEDYLEKILQNLRRADIVEAKKGISGGYSLIGKKTETTVWDIVCALDGPIKTFASPVRKGVLPCFQVSHCQTNEVLRKLENVIENSLSAIKISDLIDDNSKVKGQNAKVQVKSMNS